MSISTAALITRNEKFLLVRRQAGGDLSERWELPGGKLNPGEGPNEALRRELKEELGIDAQIGTLAATARFDHGGEHFELLAFYTTADLANLTLREHADLCWRTPVAARSLDLAPSDRSVMDQLTGTESA